VFQDVPYSYELPVCFSHRPVIQDCAADGDLLAFALSVLSPDTEAFEGNYFIPHWQCEMASWRPSIRRESEMRSGLVDESGMRSRGQA
jgi:hypothetical protein